MRRVLYPLTAAAILAYFFFFAWKSLAVYFDQDDMYNLYMAWSKPVGPALRSIVFFWNGAFRPLGVVYYRGIFALAGFNPLPFHIVTLAFGVVNLALCFWFTRLVSGSDRIAALAALIFAFHTRLMEVWFRTAVVYDVLCFTFLYLAACLYIAARRKEREFGAARIAAIMVCFILALDAKEMAVCLPVFLVAYELLFERARPKAAKILIAVLCVMAIAYAIGKLSVENPMTTNPDYKLDLSYARFANVWSVYLGYLFVRGANVPQWLPIAVIGGMLAAALLCRSKIPLFAWVVIIAGMLPVSFAPRRGGFVMFISWVGWTLYAATVLVALQDLITRRAPQFRTALACLAFVIVGWRFGRINLHDQRIDPRHWLYDGSTLVHQMVDQMRALHPNLPQNASMLFLNDSFTTEEWTPVFIVQLIYKDPGLTIDRVKMMNPAPTNWDGYQYVFTYADGKYLQVR
jgi:hypothetical protein